MPPRYLFRPPPLAYRILRGLGLAILLFLALSATLVLLLRFAPPPLTGVMVERYLETQLDRVSQKRATKTFRHEYNWVPLSKISPVMGLAVVTAEDQQFAEHFGFDWEAIAKAIEYNQKHRRTRGAYTISQQTAKNVFLWTGRSWLRKGLEAYFTLLIETLWPKERILEVYLNVIEYGTGIYGVEAASQHFFGKNASKLNVYEAALLAAVLPNPHIYRADKPGSYVLERQRWILENMHRVGGAEYIKNL